MFSALVCTWKLMESGTPGTLSLYNNNCALFLADTMQDYFFGTMDEYIETGYAPTGRATCRACRSKIVNGEVRLGEIMESDHFNSRNYYHVTCFQIKPLFRNIDPQRQIYKLDQLEETDRKAVIGQVQMEKNRLNGGGKGKGKKESAKTAKSKPNKDEKEEKKIDHQAEKKPPKRVTRSSSRTQAKSKPKSKPQKKRPPSASLQPSPKQSPSTERSPSPSPEKKGRAKLLVKASSKSTKSSAKKLKKAGPEQAYKEQQKKKMKQLREKYSQLPVARLKQILDANSQSKTGAKDDLVEKCADGELLGRIPLCSYCGGGKLRFMWKCSLYQCPGYMDDEEFKHCNRYHTMADVKREPWVIPP